MVGDFRLTNPFQLSIALRAGRQCLCALAGLLGLMDKTFVQAMDLADFAFHAAHP
jgi:hypothetical protein